MQAPVVGSSPKVPFFYASSDLSSGVPGQTRSCSAGEPRALFFRTPLPEVLPPAPGLLPGGGPADVTPSAPPMNGEVGELFTTPRVGPAATLHGWRRRGARGRCRQGPYPLPLPPSPTIVPDRASPASVGPTPVPRTGRGPGYPAPSGKLRLVHRSVPR